MAFPSFPGYGYGYGGAMQSPQDQYMQRLSMMQPQAAPPQQPTPSSLIRVTGMDGAKAYPMPPNSTAALFDGGDDILYVKSTDGAGFPTIRAFRFTPIDTPAPVPTQGGEYVTRAEFEKLKEAVLNAQHPVSAEPADPGTSA